MPPELLKHFQLAGLGGSTNMKAVDVWAVGCILVEMLTDFAPFVRDFMPDEGSDETGFEDSLRAVGRRHAEWVCSTQCTKLLFCMVIAFG